MSQPKWQRARVLRRDGIAEWAIGAEFWVRAEQPMIATAYRGGTDDVLGCAPRYRTNFRSVRFPDKSMTCATDNLELLARSPDDFADDVPLVDYAEWAPEQQAKQ